MYREIRVNKQRPYLLLYLVTHLHIRNVCTLLTSHDGGHFFVDHESLRRMVLKPCSRANFRDAQSDQCICMYHHNMINFTFA